VGHKKVLCNLWIRGFSDKAIFDAGWQVLSRVAASNAAIERGAPGEFGRPLTVREIKSEVALHYLFNFNQRRFRDEVEHGVSVARTWCDANL